MTCVANLYRLTLNVDERLDRTVGRQLVKPTPESVESDDNDEDRRVVDVASEPGELSS